MEEEKVSSWDHDSTAAHHGSALIVIDNTTCESSHFDERVKPTVGQHAGEKHKLQTDG